jgi:flagellar motor switch protein FliG
VVERLLAALDAREPDVAARVRKLMFGFEDLRRIDPGTFGILISECSADKLAIALSAAPDDLRTLFLSNMSERAGNMLKDEIDNLPAQRKRVVEETQAEIVALAKRMIEEGRIMLVEEADDADGQ